MKDQKHQTIQEIVKIIAHDRHRTNILKNIEQKSIAYLVQRIPSWISSDMLTAIGFFGNIIIFFSFVLAAYVHVAYLILASLGFAISWFGDSLDGRIAYYRNIPRKWYGLSLDITIDWIGIVLMCTGFIVYVEGMWKLIGFVFVVLYGWEMISTLVRYKITNKYSIDSGLFGPTEVRIIISGILILEVFLKDSILVSGTIACVLLFISCVVDTFKLLKLADIQDKEELEKKKSSGM
ncbi:MAG: CDP-alcohol phosphatidyltransferase family protein [Paludibacter sp.]